MAKIPDIGEQAEDVVVAVLNRFIQQKTKFQFGHRIASCVHSRKSDAYDEAGIDVLAVFNTGLALPLQIGLSNKKLGRHLRRYPSIRCVFIVGDLPRGDKELWRVRQRLYRTINNAIAACATLFNGAALFNGKKQ